MAYPNKNSMRQQVRENVHDPNDEKILWSRHAMAAIVDGGLKRADVQAARQDCWIIDEYPPMHRPLPDCLIPTALSDGSLTLHEIQLDNF